MTNIKRSARSISLGLNRVEQNKAAHATAMANEQQTKSSLVSHNSAVVKADSRGNSRPGVPLEAGYIPPLSIPSPFSGERLQLAGDDSEDSSEMHRSYAMANIDINMLYSSPIQIKKDAELLARDLLLSPRGAGIDTVDFFGEDCYGVVSWKDSTEKVKFHYDENLQKGLDRDKERVASTPLTMASVMPKAEEDPANNKSSMHGLKSVGLIDFGFGFGFGFGFFI
jgi:hypothetical protein